MIPGEKFEIESFNYLKNKYETKKCTFLLSGGMDATHSDIAVLHNNQTVFYIETKMNIAQSGQFVILNDIVNKKFYFSPRNKSTENHITDMIIKYINENYISFTQAGTTGIDIEIDSSIFAEWIINHYKKKNVKYCMTYNDGFIIFPIEKFKDYFHISSKARNKGSGSTQPTKKHINTITHYIKDNYNVIKTDTIKDGQKNRLFAYTEKFVNDEKFILNQLTYQFSQRSSINEYEIRKLNRTTKNTTVIFSIKSLSKQHLADLLIFEQDINKYLI